MELLINIMYGHKPTVFKSVTAIHKIEVFLNVKKIKQLYCSLNKLYIVIYFLEKCK